MSYLPLVLYLLASKPSTDYHLCLQAFFKFQVFVNDFNASVTVGTIIEHNFVTTRHYASIRVKMATRDDEMPWAYLEVDDFAASCSVMCEHAGISLPKDAMLRVMFATSALPISAGDPFHQFLKGFHHILSTCITHREVSEDETQAVRKWVLEHLQRSPSQAFDYYSSSI
jgi:hypothetical protein